MFSNLFSNWKLFYIDTASMYKNEDIVGEALKEWFDKGIRREDMFITTKIWRTQYYDVEGALRESLSKLQLDYIDLYLVHWMITDIDLENWIIKGPPLHQVWKEMEALVDKGLTRSIGFSNWGVMMIINNACWLKH